jgi:hypothetical protein
MLTATTVREGDDIQGVHQIHYSQKTEEFTITYEQLLDDNGSKIVSVKGKNPPATFFTYWEYVSEIFIDVLSADSSVWSEGQVTRVKFPVTSPNKDVLTIACNVDNEFGNQGAGVRVNWHKLTTSYQDALKNLEIQAIQWVLARQDEAERVKQLSLIDQLRISEARAEEVVNAEIGSKVTSIHQIKEQAG